MRLTIPFMSINLMSHFEHYLKYNKTCNLLKQNYKAKSDTISSRSIVQI